MTEAHAVWRRVIAIGKAMTRDQEPRPFPSGSPAEYFWIEASLAAGLARGGRPPAGCRVQEADLTHGSHEPWMIEAVTQQLRKLEALLGRVKPA